MLEGIKGEVEVLTQQLQEVRKEVAPGEAEAQRCQSAISVATSERNLLLKRGQDAAKKLQVNLASVHGRCPPFWSKLEALHAWLQAHSHATAV